MRVWINLLLACALVITALVVVRIKHENRTLVGELDALRAEHERLEMEWAQLQLEEATLAHNNRIDKLAREQLGMVEPHDYVIVEAPR